MSLIPYFANSLIEDFEKLLRAELNDQSGFGADFVASRYEYPKCDIISTEESVLIEAAVPGLSKEEVSIDVRENFLTITGNKRQDSAYNYLRRELKRSYFTRSFRLDKTLDTSKISASFINGIVKITIPRVEKIEPVARKVTIQ